MDGRCVEVVTFFEDSILSVRHLRPGQRFVAGTRPIDDLAWPLAGTTAELIRVRPSGAIEIMLASALSMQIEVLDDESRVLPEPLRFVEEPATGARFATLPPARRARLQLDRVSLLVGVGAAPRRRHLPPRWDLRTHAVGAITAAVFLLMLATLEALPRAGAWLAIDPFALTARGVTVQIEAPVSATPLRSTAADALAATLESGYPSALASNIARLAPAAIQPRRTRAPTPIDAGRAVANAGILGALHAAEGAQLGAAIFGRGSALGEDAENVLGGLVGTQVGEAGGPGVGDWVQSGRTGSGEGTISLGNLGNVGRRGGGGGGGVCGCMEGDGMGSLGGRLAHAPDVVAGSAQSRGALDKEVIRRVVRRHINEVKFCYGKELEKNPDLVGRIQLQFAITGAGAVVASVVKDSTMHSAPVEQCLVEAVRRWEFPKPRDGGIVIVSYPFSFKAAGAD